MIRMGLIYVFTSPYAWYLSIKSLKIKQGSGLNLIQSPPDTSLAGLQGPTSLEFSYKRYAVKIKI